MLIPSIDLMGGKIVQLVQGRRKALEFDNFQEWIERFAKYPLVQLIDLDAAMGRGQNPKLLREFASQLPCQVGGGIRTIERARELLKLGARRVIFGSSLICNGKIDLDFARTAAQELRAENLVFAADCKAGRIAVKGWQERTAISAQDLMRTLEPFCSAFLYTHIDTEGMLQGIPLDVIRELRVVSARQLIAAGGIRSQEEIDALDAMGVDAVVGMAIYQGLIAV
jgi:phosphoribosylformimino-5-aminoimidazole carboxamide ribotide isomerase